MKVTMRELSADYADIRQRIEDYEGPLTSDELHELMQAEAEIDASMDVKAETYAFILNDWALAEGVIKAEEARLAKLKKKLQGDQARLKEYATQALVQAGKSEAGGVLGKLKVVTGRFRLEVVDEASVMKEFIKMTPSFDKQGMKDKLSQLMKSRVEDTSTHDKFADKSVPGAMLVRGESTVKVK